MSWWDAKAAALQMKVRVGEDEDAHANMFDEDDARRAMVFLRQDAVLIYSQLSSLNGQVRTVKWLLAALVLIGGLNLF